MGWVHNATPEVNAQSNYPTILGVCFSLTGAMIVVVCLRLYIRIRNRRMAVDDYVMIVTMVSLRFEYTAWKSGLTVDRSQ